MVDIWKKRQVITEDKAYSKRRAELNSRQHHSGSTTFETMRSAV